MVNILITFIYSKLFSCEFWDIKKKRYFCCIKKERIFPKQRHNHLNMRTLRTAFIFTSLVCALFVTGCSHDDDMDPDVVIQISPANDTLFPYSSGLLSGVFDVGDNVSVRFSRGNLQYKASTNEWRLALNQYDVIGQANATISPSNSCWIDLFSWGTSGMDSMRPPYICTVDTLYPSDYDGDASFLDWGYANYISNGGRDTSWLCGLSSDQWKYLLKERYNAEKKHGLAIVEGVKGVVLLPEMWYMPDGCTFIPDTNELETLVIPNVYNKKKWALMESHGAVFLPFAGMRLGNEVRGVNSAGYYWTSTASSNRLLCKFIIPSDKICSKDYWYKGFAVRLVYLVPIHK